MDRRGECSAPDGPSPGEDELWAGGHDGDEWMVTGMGLGGHLLVLTLVAVLVVTVVGSVWSVRRLRAGDADTEAVRSDVALHRLRQR